MKKNIIIPLKKIKSALCSLCYMPDSFLKNETCHECKNKFCEMVNMHSKKEILKAVRLCTRCREITTAWKLAKKKKKKKKKITTSLVQQYTARILYVCVWLGGKRNEGNKTGDIISCIRADLKYTEKKKED